MSAHGRLGASWGSSCASTPSAPARAAGSGHPTSSMSAADLMAVLIGKYLHYDFGKPDDPRNDHLIFSKGHASPLLYAIYKAAGAIDDDELLTYRKFGSRLEGHPTPVLPWVDVATGSLGQGLPIGVGVALAGKHLDRLPYRVWVLCGDSRDGRGLDVGGLRAGRLPRPRQPDRHHRRQPARPDAARRCTAGTSTPTPAGPRLSAGTRIEIDGHDVEAIDARLRRGDRDHRPADRDHRQDREGPGRRGGRGQARRARQAARRPGGGDRGAGRRSATSASTVPKPRGQRQPHKFETAAARACRATSSATKVATRKAYGDALAALGAARGDVVALDGEVGNSTYAEELRARRTPSASSRCTSPSSR